MICPKCDAEIQHDDRKFFLAIDNPYLNVYVHKECWDDIKDRMPEYMSVNVLKFQKAYWVQTGKNRKKNRNYT